MREKPIFVSAFFALLISLTLLAPLWAARPDIQIELNLDKMVPTPSYEIGEPVGVSVRVSYGPEVPEDPVLPSLLVSQGFASKIYYLEMRVIDPTGRTLLVKRQAEHLESPDAPPLPWLFYDGRFIQTADCDVLESGFEREASIADIRPFYDIGLPGYYSLQVQLSVSVFKGAPGDPCNFDDYEFKGVLKSQTRYFYLQGSTEGVKVIPDQWSTKWTVPDKKAKQVQIHIRPDEGETTADYLLDTVRLNGVKPYRVDGLKPMIKAYFDATELIQTLGPLQVGQQYTVYISGQHRVGASYQTFAKIQSVRIVN